MKIIIPLAGPENRDIFKPFTVIDGKLLIQHVIKQYAEWKNIQFFFITLKEYEKKWHVSRRLVELFGSKISVELLSHQTDGAPCTILAGARHTIDNDEEILIELADVIRDVRPLFEAIQAKSKDIAGIIPIQRNTHMQGVPWGYVTMNKKNEVTELREKQYETATKNATMGLYYFFQGKEYVHAAEKMIQNRSFIWKESYFVGPIYNELIKEGKKIITANIPIIKVIGK